MFISHRVAAIVQWRYSMQFIATQLAGDDRWSRVITAVRNQQCLWDWSCDWPAQFSLQWDQRDWRLDTRRPILRHNHPPDNCVRNETCVSNFMPSNGLFSSTAQHLFLIISISEHQTWRERDSGDTFRPLKGFIRLKFRTNSRQCIFGFHWTSIPSTSVGS